MMKTLLLIFVLSGIVLAQEKIGPGVELSKKEIIELNTENLMRLTNENSSLDEYDGIHYEGCRLHGFYGASSGRTHLAFSVGDEKIIGGVYDENEWKLVILTFKAYVVLNRCVEEKLTSN